MVFVLHADLFDCVHYTDLQYLSSSQLAVLIYVHSNLFCKGGR